MDIRFFIVGAPFLIAFFYTLFWLRKWGAFNSPNDNLPETQNLIEQAWYKCGRPQEIFVFSDLKGATPSNGLFSWLKGKSVLYRGVTGVNLPMLVCAINHRSLPLDSLLEKVLEAKDVAEIATLPTLDEARAKITGILSAPIQKFLSILLAPGSKIAILAHAKSKKS